MGTSCGAMGKDLLTLAFLFAKLPNHNNVQLSVGFYNEFYNFDLHKVVPHGYSML